MITRVGRSAKRFSLLASARRWTVAMAFHVACGAIDERNGEWPRGHPETERFGPVRAAAG